MPPARHRRACASSSSPPYRIAGSFLLQGELFFGDAEHAPVRGLRHDTLEGFELHVGDVARRGSDGRAARRDLARGVDHDAPELYDGDVARAQPLPRAAGD